ncbi:DUF5134 domain-containing protein [Actinomadura sp. DC4]|uniref:DUF5134 domain-containing protein n=1 Tax=Actinomadura sp. DC4 TaxID=3055069 RepID=UPI0025B0B9DC|nr:DUF5134 domain-containing protein [Actinomadura sp. DC4]MDN3353633.1 DUF5134 domain-containing protein [Actinomadura sp. DC4]
MSLPSYACWCLTVAFACAGGWFLYRCARSTAGAAERLSLFLHVVMALVMIPMVWGARVPHTPQVAVLAATVAWFAVLAVRAGRMMPAIQHAHHALMAAVMIWMVVMPAPAGGPVSHHAGMAPMGGPAPAAVTLAGYFFLAAAVWLAEAGTATGPRRLPAAAGHAAMSLGTAVLTLAMS